MSAPIQRNSAGGGGRVFIRALPFAWLAVFLLAPLLIVLKISLSDPLTAQPPYRPIVDWADGLAGLAVALRDFDLDNFRLIAGDELYWSSVLSSLRIAAASTLMLLLIGYPIAHAMARAPARWQHTLVMLIILPFWTSFLIRVYAWIGILKPEGLLSAALLGAGLIDAPLSILNTDAAVYIGIVYAYLPFMVLPLYATLHKLDPALLEAAQDLGAPPWQAFWRITLPLSWPGIAAGSLLCFIPAVGEFVIPDLLGGPETLMIGKTMWSEFFANRDWPLASALAIVLLALLLGPIIAFREIETRRLEGRR